MKQGSRKENGQTDWHEHLGFLQPMIADSAFYQFEALSPPRPWRADSHQCMRVAVHGRTGTFLNEIEISEHSSVAWENGM